MDMPKNKATFKSAGMIAAPMTRQTSMVRPAEGKILKHLK